MLSYYAVLAARSIRIWQNNLLLLVSTSYDKLLAKPPLAEMHQPWNVIVTSAIVLHLFLLY